MEGIQEEVPCNLTASVNGGDTLSSTPNGSLECIWITKCGKEGIHRRFKDTLIHVLVDIETRDLKHCYALEALLCLPTRGGAYRTQEINGVLAQVQLTESP